MAKIKCRKCKGEKSLFKVEYNGKQILSINYGKVSKCDLNINRQNIKGSAECENIQCRYTWELNEDELNSIASILEKNKRKI